MRLASSSYRAVYVLALAAGTAMVPAPVAAQLAVQRSSESFLVLPPMPATPGDTAFAIQLGDAIRKKVDGKLRLKLNVVKKEKIVEALSSSGFPPDAILDENGATQLARFMNVDSYVHGSVTRSGGNPVLHLRLVDSRSSGLSGWIHLNAAAGLTADKIAEAVADSVDLQVKAAEKARECLERRDKKEYGSAQDRAAKAFAIYPNHPSTAMCLANIFETMKAPADSQISALRKAVKGDSLHAQAWDRLGRQYQAKGDTAAWAATMIQTLALDPTDMRKRMAAAELQFRIKKSQEAVALLDEGLERAPGDPAATATKLRYCFEGQMWGCSLTAMEARYETDTVAQKDSMAMKQLLATAGATNDPNAVPGFAQLPDAQKKYYQLQANSAAILKWTGVAVQKFPTSVSFWKQRAAALKESGDKPGALAAYRKIAELDPKDINSRIAAVQMLSEELKIDSTIPLDQTRLAEIDKLLGEVASNSADENIKMNVALLYFTPASKMVQAHVALDKALEWFAKSKANDVKKQLTTQTAFFEGLTYFFGLQAFDVKAIQDKKDCKGLDGLSDQIAKMKAAMAIGASVQPQTADQLIKGVAPYVDFIPKAKAAWKCK